MISLLLFYSFFSFSLAGQSVTWTCSAPTLPTHKGDRGPRGPRGHVGATGAPGHDGAPGESCDELREIVSRLEARVELLERSLPQPTTEPVTPYSRNWTSCKEANEAGNTANGLYPIRLGSRTNIEIYCDMERGGWNVFQRREDGSVNFYRNWAQYAAGFGNKSGEYWLGLDILHTLTSRGAHELRVDLTACDGDTAYAVYSNFSVAGASDNYRLTVRNYTGTAGERGMSEHSGYQFSTFDRDNDNLNYYCGSSCNCAQNNRGGWWYNGCMQSNLNGEYSSTCRTGHPYPFWYFWRYSFQGVQRVEMKIRPRQ